MAHAGGEKHLQRLEASQCQRQSRGRWRTLSVFPLQVHEGLKAPLSLSTHTEQSPFGSGLRGKQKGTSRLLKPVAPACAQALNVLEEGQLGRGVLQSVGDNMAHIADPRRPMRGLKEGIDETFLDSGAAVTHHMRGPPTALEKREENRVDPFTVPCLAQAQTNHFDLLQRQRFAHAEGRDWDPQHNEGLLAPDLHRKIGDANPLRIERALSLW